MIHRGFLQCFVNGGYLIFAVAARDYGQAYPVVGNALVDLQLLGQRGVYPKMQVGLIAF